MQTSSGLGRVPADSGGVEKHLPNTFTDAMDICVLLPITSKGTEGAPLLAVTALQRLATSMQTSTNHYKLSVCIGIDDTDPLQSLKGELVAAMEAATVQVKIIAFRTESMPKTASGCTPICWMWNKLAIAAVEEFNPAWTILLGDDVEITPQGWPDILLDDAKSNPGTMLICLLDEADPGFPSFSAANSRHLKIFGSMLPEEFINQGGDPFLHSLYRSFGAARICHGVKIRNGIGGMNGSFFSGDSFVAPRYERCPLPLARYRQLLEEARSSIESTFSFKRSMQVGIAVPTFRTSMKNLEEIVAALFFQVDNPAAPTELLEGLKQLQLALPDKVRIRRNQTNNGAPRTRNQLLDECGSCGMDYVIFFDDDALPAKGCVDEYVGAFINYPQDRAFAGPTYLPRLPNKLLPTSILMSDVGFFWDAPERIKPFVPWAVTANMAVKYSKVRFRDGFPKTGGGEDVDFCLLLGHRLRSVAEATATHPWWPQRRPKIYMRFWGWAFGDGRLIDLWPELTYRRAPNAIELLLFIAIFAIFRTFHWQTAALAAGAVLISDVLMDVVRNCFSAERRVMHVCSYPLRPSSG